uniref:Uncharacterized protein n=1 Tax=Salix viminalis TaxID=40686 RepID=A0A6N2LCL2_SALVM
MAWTEALNHKLPPEFHSYFKRKNPKNLPVKIQQTSSPVFGRDTRQVKLRNNSPGGSLHILLFVSLSKKIIKREVLFTRTQAFAIQLGLPPHSFFSLSLQATKPGAL